MENLLEIKARALAVLARVQVEQDRLRLAKMRDEALMVSGMVIKELESKKFTGDHTDVLSYARRSADLLDQTREACYRLRDRERQVRFLENMLSMTPCTDTIRAHYP